MTTTPQDVVVATSAQDARAADAVRTHHAEMAGRLRLLTQELVDRAAEGAAGDADRARDRVLAFATGELVPHARAEEEGMYPAAARDAGLRALVEAMVAEHVVITGLVDEVREAPDAVTAAAAARALLVLFETHLAKENDQVLPVLVADPATSLAELLDGMHELLGGGTGGGHEHAGHDHGDVPAAPAPGACGCGHTDDGTDPELDVRAVPHAIRHATVFGAFDAVPAGKAMVLVAPHDPKPLLAQLSARTGNGLGVDYLESGPEAWRLRLTRV
ncbi:DUF2249 domain-containing protein [Thalassiella azotivora]